MNNNALQLVTSKQFNGITFDCYQDKTDFDAQDFGATREQIGALLEYVDPEVAITKIHERHKKRLDKFSTVTKLTRVEGGRTVTRDVIMYNFKGLLEICRYSNQPKAEAVIDFVWGIADEIRRNGFYSLAENNDEDFSGASQERKYISRGTMRAAAMVFEAAGLKDKDLAKALDGIFEHYTGISALRTAGVGFQRIACDYWTSGNGEIRHITCEDEYHKPVVFSVYPKRIDED